MTLTQLKYFVALAETLNFSRVARDFYVAQTSISYSIQALEHEIGVKLFDRTTKSTQLTTGGHLFYEKVRPAIELISRAQAEAIASMETSTLMIGCSRLCSGRQFYNAVHTLQVENPKVQLMLSTGEPELDLFSELDAGKIDIAVYLTNPFSAKLQQGQYITQQFPINAPRKIIVSKDHPYAQHREGLPSDCLKSCRRITYSNLEDVLLRTPNADEWTDNTAAPLIAKDFQSLLDMVGANLGVACLPIVSELETEMLCTLPCLENHATERFVTLAFSYALNNPSPYVPRVANALAQSYLHRL